MSQKVGKNILYFALAFSLLAPTARLALGNGGESSVGTGIGPDSAALLEFQRSQDVKSAILGLTRMGYQEFEHQTRVTVVGGKCYHPSPDATFTVCDRDYLVTRSYFKDGSPIYVVGGVAKLGGRGTRFVFVPSEKLGSAFQQLAP